MDELSQEKVDAGEKLEPPEAPANDPVTVLTQADAISPEEAVARLTQPTGTDLPSEAALDHNDRTMVVTENDPEPVVDQPKHDADDLIDPPKPLDITEPPVDVGMFVRMDRGKKEVPLLVMEVWRDGVDEVVSGLCFSMQGPAHVRPIERLERTPPGGGGWWHEWEGRI